ncbi:MAG TPA: hypothetical protein VEK07_19520 [Polyangiaceae bacterium]|nr:hypothetical protein [Polyangiaceae bacterium]
MALGLLGRPCLAANDVPSAAELQSARALFAQAEENEDADQWQDALEKLRLVSHVKLTAGVRYHIALCETHLGELANALEDYSEAQSQARVENAEDVLRLVGGALADLSPRVPRLTLRVVPEFVDATVLLDGSPLDRSRLGVPIPIDPGPHKVDASAPHRSSIHAAVMVHERESTILEVPLVETTTQAGASIPAGAPVSARVSSPPDRPGEARYPTRPAAIAATAASVGLAGLGVAAFVVAGNQQARAIRDCAAIVSPSPDACNDLKSPVRAWDWTAAASWTAAAIAATTAIVLWTRHPSPMAASASLVIGPASLVAAGNF